MGNTSVNFRISSFRRQVFAWIVLFFLLCSFLPSVSMAQQPTATISALSGTVLVNGQKQDTGMVLHAGDIIETQAETTVVLELSDGSLVELGEQTRLDMTILSQTTTGVRVSRMKLLWGHIRAALSPDHQHEGSSFDIETPNAVIGVKFSQPDIEVSYDSAKQETIGLAHTVELMAKNLLTDEEKLVPIGSTVIIVGTTIKIVAGILAIAGATEAGTAGAGATSTGTSSTGSTGMGTSTKIAIGVGAAAAAGGVAAVVASSGNSDGNDSSIGMVGNGVYTWNFYEKGTTIGCVNLDPEGPDNGPWIANFSLQVELRGNTLTGSGVDSNDQLATLEGTISGMNVQFRRRGGGWTPGYGVIWNYSGVIQGNRITGTFSGGGGIPGDPYSEGCSSSGTFTVTIE